MLFPADRTDALRGVNHMKKVQVTGTTRTRALTRKW
jgi:hypothetical protein